MEDKLVSIIVITYNSAQYVLETLESAKAQGYKNIELIISDDCSSDNTVEVCDKWISLNRKRFVRCVLLTSEKNNGVSANCNRGLYVCKGEWIKLIAGDDILLNDCIYNYVQFTLTTKSRFIFGLPFILINPEYNETKIQMESFYRNSEKFFKLSALEQFKYLLINEMPVNPPTSFFHRKTTLELNGFDQRYSCEDLPLLLTATSNGHQLALLKRETIQYRVHDRQLSSIGKEGLINEYWFYEQLTIKKPFFKFNFICSNPRVYFEYLVQICSKKIILKMGNKKSSSVFFNWLRIVKRKISISYR